MKFIFPILLITAGLFNACKTIQCGNQFITPVFVGFAPADLDTIIVRQFQSGNNFQVAQDTAVFTNNPGVAAYFTNSDTTMVLLNIISGEEKYIMPGHDWQIYIPAKKMTVNIADIVSPQRDYKCFGDCGCANPINSIVQNGQEVMPAVVAVPYSGYNYVMYIQ